MSHKTTPKIDHLGARNIKPTFSQKSEYAFVFSDDLDDLIYHRNRKAKLARQAKRKNENL